MNSDSGVITMTLESSKFWPVAIGFFGLSTGYCRFQHEVSRGPR
jgi:hypothetical protein